MISRIKNSLHAFRALPQELHAMRSVDIANAITSLIIAFYIGRILMNHSGSIAELAIFTIVMMLNISVGFQTFSLIKIKLFKNAINLYRLSFILQACLPFIYLYSPILAGAVYGFAHGAYYYAWFIYSHYNVPKEHSYNYSLVGGLIYVITPTILPVMIYISSEICDTIKISNDYGIATIFIVFAIIGFWKTFGLSYANNSGTCFTAIKKILLGENSKKPSFSWILNIIFGNKTTFAKWAICSRLDFSENIVLFSFISFAVLQDTQSFAVFSFIVCLLSAIVIFSHMKSEHSDQMKTMTFHSWVITAFYILVPASYLYYEIFGDKNVILLVMGVVLVMVTIPMSIFSCVVTDNEMALSRDKSDEEAMAYIVLRDFYTCIGRAGFAGIILLLSLFLSDTYTIIAAYLIFALSFQVARKLLAKHQVFNEKEPEISLSIKE